MLLAGAACRGPVAPIGDDAYVDVMSRLLVADTRLFDPALVDSAKAAILAEWSVSGEDLVEYSRIWGPDSEKMAELWERIGTLVDSLAAIEAESLRDNPGSGGP